MKGIETANMSYSELASLQKQIAQQMSAKRADAVTSIANNVKEQCEANGIEVAEVVAALSRRASAANVKYRDPASGKTWTGRGKRPGWLTEAINAGKKLEEFAA